MVEKRVEAVEHITRLRDVFDEAKKDYESDPGTFHKKNIFKMMRFIKLYADFMSCLGAKLNEDAMHELQDLDEELYNSVLEFRKEWDEFLVKIEQESKVDKPINELQSISESKQHFINVEANESVSLYDLHKSFRIKSGIKEEKKSYVSLVMLRHFA